MCVGERCAGLFAGQRGQNLPSSVSGDLDRLNQPSFGLAKIPGGRVPTHFFKEKNASDVMSQGGSVDCVLF